MNTLNDTIHKSVSYMKITVSVPTIDNDVNAKDSLVLRGYYHINKKRNDVRNWLNDNSINIKGVYNNKITSIDVLFRSEEDAFFFKLAWGGNVIKHKRRSWSIFKKEQLNFTNKEEYDEWVKEWKHRYKLLSKDIKNAKKCRKREFDVEELKSDISLSQIHELEECAKVMLQERHFAKNYSKHLNRLEIKKNP